MRHAISSCYLRPGLRGQRGDQGVWAARTWGEQELGGDWGGGRGRQREGHGVRGRARAHGGAHGEVHRKLLLLHWGLVRLNRAGLGISEGIIVTLSKCVPVFDPTLLGYRIHCPYPGCPGCGRCWPPRPCPDSQSWCLCLTSTACRHRPASPRRRPVAAWRTARSDQSMRPAPGTGDTRRSGSPERWATRSAPGGRARARGEASYRGLATGAGSAGSPAQATSGPGRRRGLWLPSGDGARADQCPGHSRGEAGWAGCSSPALWGTDSGRWPQAPTSRPPQPPRCCPWCGGGRSWSEASPRWPGARRSCSAVTCWWRGWGSPRGRCRSWGQCSHTGPRVHTAPPPSPRSAAGSRATAPAWDWRAWTGSPPAPAPPCPPLEERNDRKIIIGLFNVPACSIA